MAYTHTHTHLGQESRLPLLVGSQSPFRTSCAVLFIKYVYAQNQFKDMYVCVQQ